MGESYSNGNITYWGIDWYQNKMVREYNEYMRKKFSANMVIDNVFIQANLIGWDSCFDLGLSWIDCVSW